MNKIFTFLMVLVAFGLIFGGVFLFSGVSSVEVSEEDFVETLEPVIRYSNHYMCEGGEPGYPDNCSGS